MAYKLLLADDSITIQKVVELTLSEEDFVVTAVGDGEAGLDTARKLMPDIIMADVFMPKMDGYELCGKLKQDPSLRHIPVILLAGTFENFDEVRAAQVKADDHLTKPFESAELIAKVKSLVERGGAAPAVEAEMVAAIEAEPFETSADDTALEADDLWNVVSMGSSEQPLAGATEAIGEDELWKRANLVSETEEKVSYPKEEEALPWSDLTAAPVEADEPEMAAVFEEPEALAVPEFADFEEDSPAEATAILNLDDLKPVYAEVQDEPSPIELAEISEPAEITPFESLEQATVATDFIPARPAPVAPSRPAPAAQPGPAVQVSADAVREQVARIVQEVLDRKVREAVEKISREMVEQIVWEVVPDLAEEVLVKEIEKLKSGIG